MKTVYFEMLDFEGKIRELDLFRDHGYVESIYSMTVQLLQQMKKPTTDKDLLRYNADPNKLKYAFKGLHLLTLDSPLRGSRISQIFYNNLGKKSANVHNRAHEEAHAVCHLGLRKKLESRMSLPNLANLEEEDFCDQAGIYAVKNRRLELPAYCLVPYAIRLRLAELEIAKIIGGKK